MKLLLDTHILLWAAAGPAGGGRLPAAARELILDEANLLLFSAASIWEVAIKARLGRSDFLADPAALRRGLARAGYEELPVTGAHGAATLTLPDHHRDPFDRMLAAQALVEAVTLVTADPQLARYPGRIRLV